MSDAAPATVFREEALSHRDRAPDPGALPRITAPWTRWAFRVLLALVAAGAAAGLLVHVDENASGPALVDMDGSRVVTVLPAAARAPLERAGRLAVDLGGGGQVTVRVLSIDAVDHATAVRRFGAAALGGLAGSSSPLLAVHGLFPRPLDAAHASGTFHAEVRVGSERLLVALLSGFGSGGGG